MFTQHDRRLKEHWSRTNDFFFLSIGKSAQLKNVSVDRPRTAWDLEEQWFTAVTAPGAVTASTRLPPFERKKTLWILCNNDSRSLNNRATRTTNDFARDGVLCDHFKQAKTTTKKRNRMKGTRSGSIPHIDVGVVPSLSTAFYFFIKIKKKQEFTLPSHVSGSIRLIYTHIWYWWWWHNTAYTIYVWCWAIFKLSGILYAARTVCWKHCIHSYWLRVWWVLFM